MNDRASEDCRPPIPCAPADWDDEFPFAKLDVYRVALQLVRSAGEIAEKIPAQHAVIKDHLVRSSTGSLLLLAEGANRRARGNKRQRFGEARGEVGEVAAALDVVIALELAPLDEARAVRHLAARVSAMLARLIAKLK